MTTLRPASKTFNLHTNPPIPSLTGDAAATSPHRVSEEQQRTRPMSFPEDERHWKRFQEEIVKTGNLQERRIWGQTNKLECSRCLELGVKCEQGIDIRCHPCATKNYACSRVSEYRRQRVQDSLYIPDPATYDRLYSRWTRKMLQLEASQAKGQNVGVQPRSDDQANQSAYGEGAGNAEVSVNLSTQPPPPTLVSPIEASVLPPSILEKFPVIQPTGLAVSSSPVPDRSPSPTRPNKQIQAQMKDRNYDLERYEDRMARRERMNLMATLARLCDYEQRLLAAIDRIDHRDSGRLVDLKNSIRSWRRETLDDLRKLGVPKHQPFAFARTV